MDRPLISFVVLSYNHESFIREAVESALSQTYAPLEIIISDDCSDDNSFEIARQIAANYSGSHDVWLNRNSNNLGTGGNINRAMRLCHGELVVIAGGDDVSLPHRTELLYQAWEESDRKATSIFSSFRTISTEGVEMNIGNPDSFAGDGNRFVTLDGDLLKFISETKPVVFGCTHCWSPTLFSYFGPLKSDLEDLVLSFRSLAVGTMVYINEPLVKYRRHGNNVSFLGEGGEDDTRTFEHREQRLRWVDEKAVAAYDNIIFDIDTLYRKGRITVKHRERLCVEAKRIRRFRKLERQMMEGSISHRLLTLAAAVRSGDVRLALRFSPRALPRGVYRMLFILRNHLRSWFGTYTHAFYKEE